MGHYFNAALKLGRPTTFNMLWEMQQAASTLAYGQVQDPNVFVDPKYEWLSISGKTMRLEALRGGMTHQMDLIKEEFLELTGETKWPDLQGIEVVDDLGNHQRGYSFLEESPFKERRTEAFFRVVERWRLMSYVPESGEWRWDRRAVKQFLCKADSLWCRVVHALYVGTQLSTRVTQFLQHQLRNADRPRNLVFQGKEALFIGRYSKTTNMKGADACIPAFLPAPLKDIVLVLLGGGFREVQALLARVIYGEDAVRVYRT